MHNNIQKDRSQMNDCGVKIKRSGQYRVMVVEDSAVIRGLITRWLNADPSITVVGSASNGAMAVQSLDRYDPEIVVLDIEMPVMNGLEALPKILEIKPDVQVLMASTLTTRNAKISMEALTLGAADYVPKPETNRGVTTSETFQKDLISKVINLAAAKRRQLGGIAYTPMINSILTKDLHPVAGTVKAPQLRKVSKRTVEILVVGSSTGGPQALMKLFSDLKPSEINIPILITQHMPASFTGILASHLSSSTGFDVVEGQNDMKLENGKAYLAPGDFHMIVEKKAGGHYLSINQNDKENFCRPSVDPMFRSAIKGYGSGCLGVILTGMGHDGLDSSRMLVEAGGNLIAQDEASSIVWGMPGVVSEAGLCCSIAPLDQIAQKIINLITGGRV
jgi:two-component system chemotaxis response regulator CheB